MRKLLAAVAAVSLAFAAVLPAQADGKKVEVTQAMIYEDAASSQGAGVVIGIMAIILFVALTAGTEVTPG